MKFNLGNVVSMAGKKSSDIIVVKAKLPNQIKEILVGGGLIVGGIIYLTTTAFYNGSLAFDEAEMKALDNIGALKD